MKIRKRVVVGAVIAITLVSYLVIKDKFLYSKNTKLYSGIEQNNVKLIDEALEEGCDINESDYINNGESKPIFRAINNNNENNREIVKYLLEQGVDVNGGEGYVPPVVMAAKNNHYDVVKYLIEKGANLVPSSDFYNVLYEAANNGNTQMIDLILKSGYPLDDNYLFSTATKAIKNRNIDVLQYLLGNGYDLKVKKDGESLLEYADDYNIAKVLVEGGLDINEYNKSAKDLKMLEYLFENGASPNRILENAITYGNTDILKLAIKYNANINCKNEIGTTALIEATKLGSRGCVKILLQSNADIGKKDRMGKTALDYAKDNNSKDIIKLLE